jgi:hypothetical protein
MEAFLQQRHRLMAGGWTLSISALEDYRNNLQSSECLEHLVDRLEDAGVKRLMSSDGGLSSGLRVQILNDYGFWLTRCGRVSEAVLVLQRVVTLAPERAVARLNLGEAARAAIPDATTWQSKRALSSMAVDADSAYLRITGKEAPGAAEFAALNISNAPKDLVPILLRSIILVGKKRPLAIRIRLISPEMDAQCISTSSVKVTGWATGRISSLLRRGEIQRRLRQRIARFPSTLRTSWPGWSRMCSLLEARTTSYSSTMQAR